MLEFHDSLYGKPLEVDFLSRLRDIRAFDSAEQLVQQLTVDVQQTKEIVGGVSGDGFFGDS